MALRRLLGCALLAFASMSAHAALFDDVAAHARQLADQPFHAEPKPAASTRPASDALTYDQYRDIRFRPDHSLWRADKLPFEVQSRLYLRKNVTTLGIAPLTSMFFSGENQPQPGDFRPEVHDSDGLMVQTGTGEWLWRPLSNPKRILTTSFAMPSLKGFGLMQRDRSYTSYEDDEARYELRPSAWITPVGDWGPGRVELVQLNTVDETNDNIVAYWVPAKLPALGQPLTLSYRMRWQGNEQQHPPGAWVTQSRSGRSFATLGKGEEQYIVDFEIGRAHV